MNEEIAKGGDIRSTGSHELSSDISTITAEINAYQRIAGEAIFEIGRRLHHVRYNPKEYRLPEGKDKHGNTIVARGAWGEWLEELGIHPNVAHRTMTVYKEFSDGKMATSPNKGLSALYEIATLPPEERDVLHELPTGETKTPDEMTVRELRELKKQLRAEKAERERLERANEELAKVADKPPEVVTEYKTEYVEVRDEEAERRLREYERRFGDISNYDESITASNRQDMIVAVGSFTRGVRDFAKRHAYLTQYREVISNLDDSHKQSYNESVIALKELADLFEMADGEVIIINQ